ncbi:MFS transporter [Streptomyces sp. CoH27]|uniref:MFS transporter n=1 Tax=Streptomyces sp. CoH27 TaxID=2875763 RepID=UPI001CD6FD25|nr:MFS transporter [Streptomyces sp. CoH27]
MTNDSEAAAKFAAEHSLTVTAHLFQAEIPKAADVRVTVVGERVFAQRVTAPDGALDWRCSGWDALEHAPVQVPAPVQAALHSYLTGFSLLTTTYSLPIAVGLITGGRLGDLYGRRKILLIGTVIFTTASLMCGLAAGPGVLIGARALQGVGAAIMIPQFLATLHVTFEGQNRSKVFALYGAIMYRVSRHRAHRPFSSDPLSRPRTVPSNRFTPGAERSPSRQGGGPGPSRLRLHAERARFARECRTFPRRVTVPHEQGGMRRRQHDIPSGTSPRFTLTSRGQYRRTSGKP